MPATPITVAKAMACRVSTRAAHHRTGAGTRHHGVDAPVHEVIDRGGRGRAQRDAQVAEDQYLPRHHSRRRQEHADHGRQHHQRDDAGLAEFEVVAPVRPVGNGGVHHGLREDAAACGGVAPHCIQSAPAGCVRVFFRWNTSAGSAGPRWCRGRRGAQGSASSRSRAGRRCRSAAPPRDRDRRPARAVPAIRRHRRAAARRSGCCSVDEGSEIRVAGGIELDEQSADAVGVAPERDADLAREVEPLATALGAGAGVDHQQAPVVGALRVAPWLARPRCCTRMSSSWRGGCTSSPLLMVDFGTPNTGEYTSVASPTARIGSRNINASLMRLARSLSASLIGNLRACVCVWSRRAHWCRRAGIRQRARRPSGTTAPHRPRAVPAGCSPPASRPR